MLYINYFVSGVEWFDSRISRKDMLRTTVPPVQKAAVET